MGTTGGDAPSHLSYPLECNPTLPKFLSAALGCQPGRVKSPLQRRGVELNIEYLSIEAWVVGEVEEIVY